MISLLSILYTLPHNLIKEKLTELIEQTFNRFRFARVCSNVDGCNNRNLFSTAKLLKQGYRYNKIRKAFSKFYHRHSESIVKYNIGLKHFCNKAYQNLYFMVI